MEQNAEGLTQARALDWMLETIVISAMTMRDMHPLVVYGILVRQCKQLRMTLSLNHPELEIEMDEIEKIAEDTLGKERPELEKMFNEAKERMKRHES